MRSREDGVSRVWARDLCVLPTKIQSEMKWEGAGRGLVVSCQVWILPLCVCLIIQRCIVHCVWGRVWGDLSSRVWNVRCRLLSSSTHCLAGSHDDDLLSPAFSILLTLTAVSLPHWDTTWMKHTFVCCGVRTVGVLNQLTFILLLMRPKTEDKFCPVPLVTDHFLL